MQLCRALRAQCVYGTGAGGALFRAGQFFGELLDAALDVRLQVLGALVLGNRAQHVPQPEQPFPVLGGFPKGLLGFLVRWAEVRGHDVP